MPRLVVIIIFVVLVAGVAAGGVFVVRQRRGDERTVPADEQTQKDQFGSLQPAEVDEQQRLLAADDDNDGLTNSEEVLWETDPNNPDSDGDGYLDGEEIAARHDPTIPAPNDKLPDEAITRDGQTQLPVLAEPLEADKYFTDDFSKGSNKSLTEQFEAEYAEDDRTLAALNEFADKQLVQQLLPRPDNNLVTSVEDTAARLEYYISVADNDNALADVTLYLDAHYQLQENNNPAPMLGLANKMRLYQEQIKEVQVPASAVEVHRLLLGHAEALALTFEQIAKFPDDPARSLVATRQLEVLDRTYYPIIQVEFQRLRAIQGSLGQ